MKISSPTDIQLFEQIASGDEAAFTRLFHKYSDELFSYSCRILHGRLWAEEVVQNLFLQLWLHRAALRSVEEPRSYLFRIAANRSIDVLRANTRAVQLRYLQTVNATEPAVADSGMSLRESEGILEQAVHLLPEKRKRIYQLRNAEGLSYQQISEQLNLSTHTVRNQLAKAIQTIRAYLVSQGVSLLAIVAFFRGH